MDYTLIELVWNNAREAAGFDPSSVRLDCCGALILKNAHGNVNSKFGWEVDHVYPEAKGGDDQIFNLRAMQWENNRSKGDDFPLYKAVVVAQNNDNIYKEEQFRVNDELFKKLVDYYNIKL